MIDSGLHVRVSQVNADTGDVVVASDYGGGRLVGKVRIPSALGAPVDFGVNLPPIADAQRRDDKVNIKPEEAAPVPIHGNSAGPLDEDEEVVSKSVEVRRDTYTQGYL